MKDLTDDDDVALDDRYILQDRYLDLTRTLLPAEARRRACQQDCVCLPSCCDQRCRSTSQRTIGDLLKLIDG